MVARSHIVACNDEPGRARLEHGERIHQDVETFSRGHLSQEHDERLRPPSIASRSAAEATRLEQRFGLGHRAPDFLWGAANRRPT